MNKTGLILIFIALYLFSFINSDCYTFNPKNKDECIAKTISEYEKEELKNDLSMTADTCCLVKVSYKVLTQSYSVSYCEPVEKGKAKEFQNALEKEEDSDFEGYGDIKYSIECSSSYIKYGLSFLMILLLN